jgi:hypothetical protein
LAKAQPCGAKFQEISLISPMNGVAIFQLLFRSGRTMPARM